MNDITTTTSLLDVILFADDTTLLYLHPDIPSKINLINNELRETSNWFKANKLSVNASKTNYMMLGTSHMTNKYIDVNKYCDANDTDNATNERSSKQKINVILDSVSLERVESTKFLGIIIDEKLDMEEAHWCDIENDFKECWYAYQNETLCAWIYIILIILYSSLTLYKLRYFNLEKYM